MPNNSRKKGIACEQRLAKDLQRLFPNAKVELVLNSGSGIKKGDVMIDNILIQCKQGGKAIRISEENLLKARKDAIKRGKSPLTMYELDSGRRYWILEDSDAIVLLDSLRKW